MLCLTSSCRSTWAPPVMSSWTMSAWPLKLAHMRAVLPFWGTQWDKTVTITCDVNHIETRWKVYTCCEAVSDTSISLAYLSTCTYKSSREEGGLLIISLMSRQVEGAQLVSCPDPTQLTWGEGVWCHKSKSLGQRKCRSLLIVGARMQIGLC